LPRVVLEFKKSITTHDVLTYSAKARKHKQVYPYLRYGLVASADRAIPRRFFTHNEALDFFLAVGGVRAEPLLELFRELVEDEVAASRCLERIAFGGESVRLFRSEVVLGNGGKAESTTIASTAAEPMTEHVGGGTSTAET
jgi:hypothetical protein